MAGMRHRARDLGRRVRVPAVEAQRRYCPRKGERRPGGRAGRSSHTVDIARETGTLAELALALSARTPILVFSGELSAAASAVAETDSVQDASGIISAPYGALILGAWQGRSSETRQLIEMAFVEVRASGEG